MLNAQDLSDILSVFKGAIRANRGRASNSNQKMINWDEIFHAVESIEIDEMFINRLHTKFDPEAGTFSIVVSDNNRPRMSIS